jgi:hypothetical protein
MPDDEAALAEALDTPPEAEAPEGTPSDAPATDWDAEDNPYKGRYDNLRSDYDSRNQRYSQYETFIENLSNPETQAEALAALGIELQEDELDDLSDPTEALTQRLDQFENYLSQQAAQAEQAEVQNLEAQWLDKSLADIEKAHGSLSSQEKKAIENLGYSVRDADGIPDYEAAFKLFSEASEASRERYLKSKDAAKVELGTAGTEKIDMTDDDAVVDYFANAIEAESQL